jgi:Protein of unknown function (DUF3054)
VTPRRPWPLLADLVCVLALAFGGKNTHEAGDSSWVVLVIAWPFALAGVLAHVALVWRGRQASRMWPEGVVVLAVTYVLGMLLRALSGRGLAPGFLVVAAIFLAVTMLGWRLILRLTTRSGAASANEAPRP